MKKDVGVSQIITIVYSGALMVGAIYCTAKAVIINRRIKKENAKQQIRKNCIELNCGDYQIR